MQISKLQGIISQLHKELSDFLEDASTEYDASYLIDLLSKTESIYIQLANALPLTNTAMGFTEEDVLIQIAKAQKECISLENEIKRILSALSENDVVDLEEACDKETIPFQITKTKYGIEVIMDMVLPHRAKYNKDYSLTARTKEIMKNSFHASINFSVIPFDNAYLVYEYHYDKNKNKRLIRDCDNYDNKYLTDLIADTFLYGGDSPDSLRFMQIGIPDEREYTKATLVKSSMFAEFIENLPSF